MKRRDRSHYDSLDPKNRFAPLHWKYPRHERRTAGLFVCLMLIMCLAPVVAAQDCPFPDSVAVPDTLDPEGYYPLQVGDSWDYVFDLQEPTGPPFRRIVQADTLISGLSFSKVKTVRFTVLSPMPGVMAVDSSYTYEAVVGGVVVEWRPRTDSLISLFDVSLPFSSCYLSAGSQNTVTGRYDTTAVLYGPDTLDLAATKTLTVDNGRRPVTFGYGVGILSDRTLDLGGYVLGGESRGAPLDTIFAKVKGSVSGETPQARVANLSVFPNPVKAAGWIEINLKSAGRVTLQIVDVLGRESGVSPVSSFLTGGRNRLRFATASLAPGVYFVRVWVNSEPGPSKPVVITK